MKQQLTNMEYLALKNNTLSYAILLILELQSGPN